MKSKQSWRLCGFLLLASLGACSSSEPPTADPGASAPKPGSAGGSATTALAGNVPPWVRRAADLGRVDPSTRLEGVSLLFGRSAAQRRVARGLLADLQDPRSPEYHRWLKPDEVAARFGAARSDVAKAVGWLESQGFTVHGPSRTRTRVLFSGTVGQLERAFATEMHRYDLAGRLHFALATAPSLPTDLAQVAIGLRGVHDVHLQPTLPRGTPEYLEAANEAGTAFRLTLGPSDFATTYDLSPLYAAGVTGAGQTIGVVGASDFHDADITAFRTAFGLDTSLVPVRDLVPYSGSSTISTISGYLGETELDLEWSGAVAKGATIAYVYTGNNPAYGPFDAILWAIEEGTYPVLTASYAGCEGYYTPAEDLYLEAMGDAASMEGITVVNAAGDWGPASCDAYHDNETAARDGISTAWPASIPSFTAVGGTMLSWGDPFPEPDVTSSSASKSPFDAYWSCSFSGSPACSAAGYVPETGWNEIAYEVATYKYFWGASGGGTSALFSKPYWQVGTTPPGTMRLVPDVSLTAAWQQVGYAMTESGALTFSGGTSAATPSFAGILALVNQALAAAHPATPVGLGNANPVLYAINASTSGTPAAAFHDIVTGNSVVPCKSGTPDCPATPPYQFGFTAGTGYDLVTGIGSVDADNLVNSWTSLAPTSTALVVTPTGSTEGATASLTATVSSLATSPGMTGSVIFYVDTTDEGGVADLSLMATGSLVPTTMGGTEGGTATASVLVPPGVLGQARVVAFYGGDARYLASWSTPAASVTSTSTLAITPSSITVNPGSLQTFTTSGGVAPVQWVVIRDTTCSPKYVCAEVEATSATDGVYQAGAVDGATTIAAIDADGAEARVTIQVTGKLVDGGPFPPPWDGAVWSGGGDGGADAASDATTDGAAEAGKDATADARADGGPADAADAGDAGPDVERDAQTEAAITDASVDAPRRSDAAHGPPPVELGNNTFGPSGCQCDTAGRPTGTAEGLSAFFVALSLLGRRRRGRCRLRPSS